MRRIHRLELACIATLLLTAASSPPTANAVAGDAWERFRIGDGPQVLCVYVPKASQQSTFTFLPMGLLDDSPGHAQWTHLAEHMVLRSTDPDALEVDGILINGETTARALRLETLAPPERWKTALERHVRWLGPIRCEEAVLRRELERIAMEEQTTVSRGATHKWALAAWGQVMAHGLDHAAVHADVQRSEPAAVVEYVAQVLPPSSAAWIVTVGPVDPKEVRDHLTHLLEDAPLRTGGKGSPYELGDVRGEHRATWDLDAHHYLEWYALPAESAEDRAALLGLHTLVLMRVQAAKGPLSVLLNEGKLLPSTELRGKDESALLFSVSVPDPEEAAEVREALHTLLDGLFEGSPSLATVLRMVETELATLPDFDLLRSRMAGSPGVERLEAQMVLSWAARELELGLTREALREALSKLDAKRVEQAMRRGLSERKRASLLLEPKR